MTVDYSKRESGAVVLLVALMLTAFVGMVALAVDMISFATSQQQSRNFAQLSALAALERYIATTGSESVKRAAALARATEVARMNLVLGGKESSAPTLVSGNSPTTVTEGVILEPGQYFFKSPESGNPCTGGESPPCFVPRAATVSVNAFRIRGEYHQPVDLRFARAVFGVERFPTAVNAIATLVPRHGCFLVDISGSMYVDSHRPVMSGGTRLYQERFAYLLKDEPITDPDNPSLPVGVKKQDQEFLQFRLGPYQTRPGANVPVSPHYLNGYSRVTPFSDQDYDGGIHLEKHPAPTDQAGLYSIPTRYNYRVETDRWDAYRGPEPLSIVLRGIHRALELFEERKVVGDMACLVFYDQTLKWTRTFNITEDIDYLKRFTEIDRTGDPNRGLELMLKHSVFPLPYSTTNTRLALTEALRQLSSQWDSGIPSSDFIVLIGDGQTNCVSCSGMENFDSNDNQRLDNDDYDFLWDCIEGYNTFSQCESLDQNRDGNVQWDWDDYNSFFNFWYGCPANTNGGSPDCSNEVGNFGLSSYETKRYVEERIVPLKIPIHTMVVGKESGPNTVDVEDPDEPGRCLTDSEKRQRRNEPGQQNSYPGVEGPNLECWSDLNWTGNGYSQDNEIDCWSPDGYDPFEAWEQKSATNPFLPVNRYLYDIATMTGGLWVPIRTRPENCVVQECIPGETRFTDPLCRTEGDQILEAMEEILGQNPFTLVVDKVND